MNYFVWQRTCVDEAGNVLPSASVTVTDVISGALAQLYSDEGVTTTGNPIAADSNGFVQFFVKSGIYTIVATLGGDSRTWTKEAIGSPYKRTAEEVTAGITPTSYQYPPGDSRRYGAVGDGVTDDTDALNNCLYANDGASVVFARGTYLISDSLAVYSNVIEGGGSREDTVITPNGDFPCFVNPGHEFIAGAIKNLTIIYNGGTQPTSASGNDNKIGIFWEIVSGRSPNYFNVEDVEVRGAWWAYYDESGSYGCNFDRFFMRDCQNGFYKTAGTTFTLNQVIGLNCNVGISLSSCLAFTLNACANDGAVITANAVNSFVSCTGLVINGWDSESNDVSGNGATLFSFVDCDGTFNAHVGHVNDFAATTGNWVAVALFNDSFMSVVGHRPQYDTSTDELTMTGDGTFYHFVAENGSKITFIGGEYPQPDVVSGSPTLTPFVGTGTARIHLIGVSYEGTPEANTANLDSDYDEDTYTLTGFSGTDPTLTLRVRKEGYTVTMQLEATSGTSDTASMTLTPALPAAFRPVRAQKISVRITDNSALVSGALVIGTDGTMTFYSSDSEAAITDSGSKGIPTRTITYSLD